MIVNTRIATQDLVAPASPAILSRVLHALTATHAGVSGTVLRVALGAVMFPHGAQKLLGWFGGYGFSGTMGFLTGTAGLPWIIAFLVIAIEFFGAIALIFGFATRIVAVGIISLFTGIIATSHFQNGFFMKWY